MLHVLCALLVSHKKQSLVFPTLCLLLIKIQFWDWSWSSCVSDSWCPKTSMLIIKQKQIKLLVRQCKKLHRLVLLAQAVLFQYIFFRSPWKLHCSLWLGIPASLMSVQGEQTEVQKGTCTEISGFFNRYSRFLAENEKKAGQLIFDVKKIGRFLHLYYYNNKGKHAAYHFQQFSFCFHSWTLFLTFSLENCRWKPKRLGYVAAIYSFPYNLLSNCERKHSHLVSEISGWDVLEGEVKNKTKQKKATCKKSLTMITKNFQHNESNICFCGGTRGVEKKVSYENSCLRK